MISGELPHCVIIKRTAMKHVTHSLHDSSVMNINIHGWGLLTLEVSLHVGPRWACSLILVFTFRAQESGAA